MAIYHLSLKIISRSKGASAVAKAAYRSGQKLYNKRTGLTHDFTKKWGVVHSEILLCRNAPKQYRNREILWNAVEQVEKNSNAQLAREIEFALPIEFDEQTRLAVAREFLQTFTDMGMCVDWSYHNKEFGKPNPHVHAMLTMRGIKPDGTWDTKEKKTYSLDEHGKRIPILDPSTGKQKIGKNGRKMWKRETVQKNNWNSQDNAEEWRALWADIVNRKMQELGMDERIDHRSFERQGLDLEATIHEGYVARQIERNGRISQKCQANRDIRERNRIRRQIQMTAKKITEFILTKAGDFIERFTKLVGSVADIRETGNTPVHSRRTADRDRKSGIRKQQAFQREQRTEYRKQQALVTEQDIAGTDRAIKELKELKQKKEAESNERIRKLMERRRTSGTTGTATERNRPVGAAKTGTGNADTDTLLAKLRAAERIAEQKRQDCEAERTDRELVRERQATSGSSRKTGTEQSHRISDSQTGTAFTDERETGRGYHR